MSELSRKKGLSIRETVLFAMLGALMFISKLVFEVIPNIHPLAMLTMVYTIVFRKKALIPIYVYVLLNGIWSGFALWWIPYLYIWTVLWGVTMLLPSNMPVRVSAVVYPLVAGLHGLCFGTLYAPVQAIAFGLDFRQMLLWIGAGLVWDVVHAIGNIAAGILILPLSKLLRKVYGM